MGAKSGKNPTFSKLMNFGPLMVTYLESAQAGLHDPKILWAKVQKRRRYGDGGENRETPTFSKPMNFGPLMVTLLESKWGFKKFKNGADIACGQNTEKVATKTKI